MILMSRIQEVEYDETMDVISFYKWLGTRQRLWPTSLLYVAISVSNGSFKISPCLVRNSIQINVVI